MSLNEQIQILRSGTGIARARAATQLGQMGNKRAETALLAALADKNSTVRSNAAFALGEVQALVAVPQLIHLLADGDQWVRKSSAKPVGCDPSIAH